jgi:elongation factor P
MDGDKPLTLELPNFADLVVTRADPGIRGDTAQGGYKSATLETGLVVQVPLFLNEGDTVRIDTRTGKYVTRV